MCVIVHLCMNPPTSNILPLIWGFSTRIGMCICLLSSLIPHFLWSAGFWLTWVSKDLKRLSKSYKRIYRIADHQQQTAKVTLASDYCICSLQPRCSCNAIIYLQPISSSAWQSILTGSRRARMWPCSSLDPWKSLGVKSMAAPAPPFLLDIKSFPLLFHFTLEVVCSSGKLTENKETEESPGLALSGGIA